MPSCKLTLQFLIVQKMCTNVYSGLTFALNRRYGMVLAGLIILVLVAIFIATVGRRYLSKKRRMAGGPLGAQPQYNGAQPWRQPAPPGHTGGYAADQPPPGYAAPSQQGSVGLRSVSPSPWRSPAERKDDDNDGLDLGKAQTPRDFA